MDIVVNKFSFKGFRKAIIDFFDYQKSNETQFDENELRNIRKLQVKSVYSLTTAMMVGNIIFATMLTTNLLGKGMFYDGIALTWCFVLCSLSIFTLYKSKQRKKSKKEFSGSERSVKNIIVSSALLSILWCMPVVVFYGLTDGIDRGVMTAIMAGILSAGAASLARVPKAATLWLLIAGTIHFFIATTAGFVTGQLADFTIGLFSIFATFGLLATVKERSESFTKAFIDTQSIKEKSEVIDLLLKDYESQATEWLWQTDENGILTRAPRQVLEMLGIDKERLKINTSAQLAREFATEDCAENVNRLMDSLSQKEEFHDITISIKDAKDGSTRWIMTRGKPQYDGDKFTGYRGICADATAAMEAEQNILYLAQNDSLTSLANRSTFNETLTRWNTANREFSIIMIDLDHFKAVNDNLGHAAGDSILIAVSERLKDALKKVGLARADDAIISRFGGDEFAIAIVKDRRGEEKDIEAISEKISQTIVQSMSETFMFEGKEINIGASVGYVVAPEDGTELSKLMNRADMALYRAKANGKSTHHRFNFLMDEESRSAKVLELDVRNALKNGQFRIAYQPIVSMDVGTDKKQISKKVGMEALLRWDHPVKGSIGPDVFIPIAEETGSIITIGEWVLKQACLEAASWDDTSTIAVNVSVKQITSSNFIHTVLGALALSGLPANRLEIEMTESVLITDPELTIATIRQLRKLGVRVSLDDFGTGYSSLSYIADFDVDRIKIDKSFIDKLGDETANAAPVIQAITNLASSLGLVTVGEGIETIEQAELLKELGCDHLQGYYFGRPEIVENREGSLKKPIKFKSKAKNNPKSKAQKPDIKKLG